MTEGYQKEIRPAFIRGSVVVCLLMAAGVVLAPQAASLQGKGKAAIDLGLLGRPAFLSYTDQDGLPQNVIESVAFDRKGYLWVGTQNGAAYYNGRRWIVVNMPNRKVSNTVFTILAASDGSMWFGTQLAGLAHWKEGRWDSFDPSNSGLPHHEIRCLLEVTGPGGEPALWIGTGGGGVARYRAGEWTTFNTKNSDLQSDQVRSLALTTSPSGRRTVWIGTWGGGLTRYEYENDQWTTFDAANSGLPSDRVRCLAADSTPAESPSLWIGTTGGGLVRYESGQWTTFNTANSGLPSDVIRSLAETVTSSGSRILWVGTNGNGLARYQDGRWAIYNTKNSLLPKNAVLSLLGEPTSSGEPSLWIGTLDGGVAHYVPGGWMAFDTRNSGLSDSQVWSLLETPTPSGSSSFWFGTSSGLARFEAGRWSVFNTTNSGLPNDFILSLLKTESDRGHPVLWVGTNGGGLARYEAGRWKTLNSKNSGLPGDVILNLLETVTGAGSHILWAGTESGGLARLESGKWTAFNTNNSALPQNSILSLLETTSPSGDSVLWVGTTGGLTRYASGQWTTFTTANSALPNNEVWGLRETVGDSGDRYLWVGTFGGGVARLDPASPRAKWLVLSESTDPALPNDTVWQIRQDAEKRIYLYTDRGIARLTPANPAQAHSPAYSLYTFTTADGLPSNGCNQGAALLDRRGRLWVGTGAGTAVFDPSLRSEDRTPKPLYIERTLLDGQERMIPDHASLAYNENNFQFEYSLLSYFREEDTRYRFQLAGFDAQPSDWKAEARKEYTNLGEGNYVFKVWARDYAGNVAGPLTVTYAIRAAPWRTWWAYAFYALVMIGGVSAGFRVQTRRLIRKEREKAQLREAELRAETAEAEAKAIEAENRRKSEELNFARQLQLSMLPKQNILLDEVEIVGLMRTATEVGGDYYDFIKIDDHRYCVAIGDATGHGVGAGLVVGMVKTALFNSVLLLKPDSTVQDLMVDLNATLKASLTHRGVGMCFSVALIDIRTMTAEVCSTGMPFPCLYRSQTGMVQTLQMPGPPLGFMKKIKVRSHTVQLEPQDRLIFLTDGFHERMNAAGECWGYETVTHEVSQVCQEVSQVCQHESRAEEIAQRLISACDQFALERETDDDMTVIIVGANSLRDRRDVTQVAVC